nr:hypothetical protein [Sinorhizobium meliloti]
MVYLVVFRVEDDRIDDLNLEVLRGDFEGDLTPASKVHVIIGCGWRIKGSVEKVGAFAVLSILGLLLRFEAPDDLVVSIRSVIVHIVGLDVCLGSRWDDKLLDKRRLMKEHDVLLSACDLNGRKDNTVERHHSICREKVGNCLRGQVVRVLVVRHDRSGHSTAQASQEHHPAERVGVFWVEDAACCRHAGRCGKVEKP